MYTNDLLIYCSTEEAEVRVVIDGLNTYYS